MNRHHRHHWTKRRDIKTYLYIIIIAILLLLLYAVIPTDVINNFKNYGNIDYEPVVVH